jgi:ABC-type glycerol-3-phosphate transport system substrate-binding protein
MRLSNRLFVVILAIAVALTGLLMPLAALPAQGQAQDTVTITVAVPNFLKEVFSDKFLGEFQSTNPGVKVNVVNTSQGAGNAAIVGLDKHLEDVGKFVSAADVIYVEGSAVSPEATKAGYYLDLSPLVSEDQSLNTADFHPAVWQAFQWDKGIWALPVSTNVVILSYNPASFDKAGLAYPNDQWTMADLDNAIRKLAQKDANGKVISKGIDVFAGYSDLILLRSLLGEGLYDASNIPNTPKLTKPGVEALLDTWYKIDKDELIGNDFNKAPLSATNIFAVVFPSNEPEQKRVGTLLPGGKAGLDTSGFAISKGTQHPDKAYALAKFLTTRAEIPNRFTATPARKSLANIQTGSGGLTINVPAEVQQLIDKAVANGFSVNEMRYAGYMAQALKKMKDEKLDAKAALEAAEIQAIKDQQTAADKKDKITVAVSTPVPETALASGKIALKFGIVGFSNQLPNKEKWDKVKDEFAASDPQVGRVDYNIGFAQIDKLAEQNDCFYLPYNAVPSVSPSLLLNLDPFLTSDTSFDKNDVSATMLTQVTRDNKIYALPISIEPFILKYDTEKFSKAGAQAPAKGWTVDAFKDALKVLKIDPKDPPPFVGANTGGVHILMLVAAYGALPLDYRSDPPVINYTDPATVEAIRQVLDLAKQGYIKYDALASLTGGGFSFGQQNAPIFTDSLSIFTFGLGNASTPQTYKPTTYPRGSKYAAISYNISTAYISANSKNPEACYRWISTVAKHPELFSAMPVRRSQLSDPNLAQMQGADIVGLYGEFDALLKDPNTISIPSQFSGGASPTGFLLQYWLYEAFDSYVLKDGDLDAGLKDGEAKAKAFQECAVNLPPLDASSMEKQREYIKAFGECATKVDPKLKPLFDLIR